MDTAHIRRCTNITRKMILDMCDKLDAQQRKIQIQQHFIKQLYHLHKPPKKTRLRRVA